MDIYQEYIMDNARNPRNVGKIKGVRPIRAQNRLCGDQARIYLSIEKGRIADIRYEIQGCILSKASLSIFSEHVKTKPVGELANMTSGDIFKMCGCKPGPSRQKCVLFGFEAAKDFVLNRKDDKMKCDE